MLVPYCASPVSLHAQIAAQDAVGDEKRSRRSILLLASRGAAQLGLVRIGRLLLLVRQLAASINTRELMMHLNSCCRRNP